MSDIRGVQSRAAEPAVRRGTRPRAGSVSPSLDRIDHEILTVLSEDCRLSTRALARRIGMSPSALQERVSRLEARGTITGYHAAVDPEALGLGLYAIVAVQLRQGPNVTQMIERIMELPEVEAVHIVTGRSDLLVEIRFEDQSHLRDAIVEQLWGIPGLERTDTMIVIESFRRPGGWLPKRREADRGRDTPHQLENESLVQRTSGRRKEAQRGL